MKFIGITFTGVDEWTEISDLARLQAKYPYAEFGVLLSKNHQTNGNRYPDPRIFNRMFAYYNIKWSAHLCGSMARSAFGGNWVPFEEYFKTITKKPEAYWDVLNRIQLNVSKGLEGWTQPYIPESCPVNGVDIIIQQNSVVESYLFNMNKNNTQLLIDPSGGKGESANWTTDNLYNENPNEIVGYAGGINKYNVIDVINFLETNSNCYYWIDLETGARDKNDRFDVYKISKILKSVDKWRNRMISKEMNHGR